MDVFEAIAKRYSYRGRYRPEPVPREDLRRIMQAGLDAPSGCNKQSTSLIGVDDPALIRELGEMLQKPGFASAPSAICVLTQRIPAIAGRIYSVQDYGAAIENVLLAVTALGYASCWVEGHITGQSDIGRRMAQRLGVPEGYELVAYLPIGTPAENGKRAQKKSFAQRAWFNGFGKD